MPFSSINSLLVVKAAEIQHFVAVRCVGYVTGREFEETNGALWVNQIPAPGECLPLQGHEYLLTVYGWEQHIWRGTNCKNEIYG